MTRLDGGSGGVEKKIELLEDTRLRTRRDETKKPKCAAAISSVSSRINELKKIMERTNEYALNSFAVRVAFGCILQGRTARLELTVANRLTSSVLRPRITKSGLTNGRPYAPPRVRISKSSLEIILKWVRLPFYFFSREEEIFEEIF